MVHPHAALLLLLLQSALIYLLERMRVEPHYLRDLLTASTMRALLLLLLAATLASDVTALIGHPEEDTLMEEGATPCPEDQVAVYRLVLDTRWSRDLFPKQYPEFRPHAQWSRIVGRSHNSSYVMYREGEDSSSVLQHFVERGLAEGLEHEGQGGAGGVLDTFTSPPIPQGEGRVETLIFLTGRHSLVSFVMRMIPSPDWFIGVDSVDLCDPTEGGWLENRTLELWPLDAGSDSGLTFTSPDWRTDPPEPVVMLTSREPDHPAASFNYPELEQLPHIAQLTLAKERVYRLSQRFFPSIPPPAPSLVLTSEDLEEMSNRLQDPSTASPELTEPATTPHHVHVARRPPMQVLRRAGLVKSSKHPTARHELTQEGAPQWPGLMVSVTMNRRQKLQRLRALKRRKLAGMRRQQQRRAHHRGGSPQPQHHLPGWDVQCALTPWSAWSSCSASCGTGDQQRHRGLVRSRDTCGHVPQLLETRWCSGHAACATKYFKWK